MADIDTECKTIKLSFDLLLISTPHKYYNISDIL